MIYVPYQVNYKSTYLNNQFKKGFEGVDIISKKNARPETFGQQRIHASLSLRAAPHLLPQSSSIRHVSATRCAK